MENPKYKFFLDEYTLEERPRYSNGKLQETYWSTPELEAGAKRVIAEMQRRGYRIFGVGAGTAISFSKPEFISSAYIGTFLNPFSVNEKVWLYTNHFASCYKYINLSEVFRHNGIANNASFRLNIGFHPGPKTLEYKSEPMKEGGRLNEYGLEVPKTYEWVSGESVACYYDEVKKFRPDVSDKVLARALDKAEELIAKYQIEDMSKFEKDQNDFPLDTTLEYRKFQMEQRLK